MEQKKNEQMSIDFDALEHIQKELEAERAKNEALEAKNNELVDKLSNTEEQLKTQLEANSQIVEESKNFQNEIETLQSLENVDKKDLYVRLQVAEERQQDFRGKYVNYRAELHQLREFIGDKKTSLLDKFDAINAPDKDQKLSKFEKMIQSFDIGLKKEEARMTLDNKEYGKDNLKMRADYNRSTKNLLGRAFSIANLKTKRALHDFVQDVKSDYGLVKEDLSSAKDATIDALGVGTAYAGNLTSRAWENSGKKVVDATVGFGKEFNEKVKGVHSYLDAQVLRMEVKAMQNDDFMPSNSNSVIARATVLGTHKVKKSLESVASTIKESTKEGFKSLVMGGKMLLNKFVKAAKTVHSVGMEGVNEREKKKATAKDGIDL